MQGLWTVIPIHCRAWTQLALERSHSTLDGVPCCRAVDDLEYHRDEGQTIHRSINEAVPLILAEISRLKVLTAVNRIGVELEKEDDFIAAALHAFTINTTPCLESLTLDFGHDHDKDMPTLPDMIFRYPFLALQNLTLINCFFPLAALPHVWAPNLTSLELETSALWPCSEQVLQLLSNLPNLERVSCNAISREHDEAPISFQHPRNIHLPILIKFHMTHGFTDILHPLTLSVDVELDLIALFDLEYEPAPEPSTIREALAHGLSHHSAAAATANISLVPSALVWNGASRWSCYRRLCIAHPDARRSIHRTLSSGQLHSVQRPSLAGISRHMPHLKGITTRRDAARGLVRTLADAASLPTAHRAFSHVRRIQLDRVNFSDILRRDSRKRSAICSAKALDEGVVTFVFRKCANITMKTMRDLARALPHIVFDWDGKVR